MHYCVTRYGAYVLLRCSCSVCEHWPHVLLEVFVMYVLSTEGRDAWQMQAL